MLHDVRRLLDILSVASAGLLVWQHYPPAHGVWTSANFTWMVLAASLLTALMFQRPKPGAAWNGELPIQYYDLVRGLFLTFFSLLVILLLTDPRDQLSIRFIGFWFILSFMLMLGQRAGIRSFVRHLVSRGKLEERFAVVGAGPIADRLIRQLNPSAGRGIAIVGVFDDRTSRLGEAAHSPCGSVADLVALGRTYPIDHIVIALPLSAEDRIRQLSHHLKALATDIRVYSMEFTESLASDLFDSGTSVPLFCISPRPIARWDALLKRCEDLVLASAALLFVSPFMLFVALAIKLDSPGPVLFRQRRHGFNNVEINVLKFRSMYVEKTDAGGAQQASRTDARITRVGRFIRSCSIDELPQLLNVLRGDMSLVGPRPLPVGMRTANRLSSEISEEYAHRHRVKPGITGWAQVNGLRGATENSEQLRLRILYDLEYIKNWSILFDIRILMKTVVTVLSRANAY